MKNGWQSASPAINVYAPSMANDFRTAAQTIAAECLCLNVRQASRRVSKLYDEALRPLGLQVSQLTVLVATAMFGEGGAKMGPIADALGLDRTTLTRNLRPLERQGWLRVARDPADGRARILLLTRAGERAIEKAFPFWEQSQKQLRALLGKGQADELRKNLMNVRSKFAEHGTT
jgi:DNA-binding MarR family transcriptional regulator